MSAVAYIWMGFVALTITAVPILWVGYYVAVWTIFAKALLRRAMLTIAVSGALLIGMSAEGFYIYRAMSN